MASLINSPLNPLADAFIPNCHPVTSQKKTIPNSTENETKTTRERMWKLSSNDCDSKHEDLVTVRHFPKVQSVKDWAEYLLFGGITTTILNFALQSPFIGKTPLLMLSKLQFPMLPESSSQVKNSHDDLTETTIVEEIGECNCPPMFGWSVPPDFIGNPFNFKYECRKKYPHSPDSKENQKSDKDHFDLDSKINDLTLDECCSAMKDIITDVYKTISLDSDTVVKCDEVSDNVEDKSKFLSFPSTSDITTEPGLIDDGIHPLLQSAPTEEENEDLLKVEKILERSLSHSLNVSFETETSCSTTVCDPPCSVWCEFLPSAAKDTFKKYIQIKGSSKDSFKQSSLGHRPIFKRSLSADDSPMYALPNRGLNKISALESKEILILRRKDPLGYFKFRTMLNKRKSVSCDSIYRQLSGNSDLKSSMWGKFDSADSLWKPLPECIPMNGHPKDRLQPTFGVAKHDQKFS